MGKTSQSLADMFSLCREAVVGVEKGNIAFMNHAAISSVGDSTGKIASSLLPEYILKTQSVQFMTTAVVGGRRAAISATLFDGVKVYMLDFNPGSPEELPVNPIEAPVRRLMANFRLATDRLEVYTEENRDERLKSSVSVLEHSYHQLRRLLLNVSTAYGIERGDMPFTPTITDVSKLCQYIAESAADFVGTGARIHFEPSDKPCEAAVDKDLFIQLLLNLLSNALPHCGKNETIKISVTKIDNSIIISVDDNGDGIAPQVLPTVFCRWRENMTLTEAISGSGIGLGVASAIAERHGGALIIESRPNRGTQVRVMLPADSGEATMSFHCEETKYVSDGPNPILTYLSEWLPAELYGPKYND